MGNENNGEDSEKGLVQGRESKLMAIRDGINSETKISEKLPRFVRAENLKPPLKLIN